MTMHKLIVVTAMLCLALILLAACAHKVAVPREGRMLSTIPEQEREQCAAQPNFPGCEHVGR